MHDIPRRPLLGALLLTAGALLVAQVFPLLSTVTQTDPFSWRMALAIGIMLAIIGPLITLTTATSSKVPWAALGEAEQLIGWTFLFGATALIGLIGLDSPTPGPPTASPFLFAFGGISAAWLMTTAAITLGTLLGTAARRLKSYRIPMATMAAMALLGSEAFIIHAHFLSFTIFYHITFEPIGLIYSWGVPENGYAFPWLIYLSISIISLLIILGGLAILPVLARTMDRTRH